MQGAPKREFRSTWIATVSNINWPSTKGTSASVIAAQKAEMDKYIEDLAKEGFTSICFQARSMCDAMYKSSYDPWSSYLTGTRGTDPGWDPLEYIVNKCHSLGMECHAWINPFRWSSGTNWNTAQDQKIKNDNWLLTGTNGKYSVINPGIPEVRQRVVDVCREIITNYKVDGFLFDDYFYPSGGTSEGTDAADYTLWQSSGTKMSFADWRRNNVRICIQQIYDMVQATRPDCRFGIGPAGVAGTASTSASKYGVNPCPTGSDWQYAQIYSDPLSWLYDGSIDYISPQLYWVTTHKTNPFGPLTEWWSYCANHFNRHHYASQSITALSSGNTTTNWQEYSTQVNLSRQYTENNAPGCVFYSVSYLNGGDATGLGNYLHQNNFTTKSLTPVITWKKRTVYNSPANIAKSGSKLTWDATSDGNRIIRYTVYAIPTSIKSTNAMAADGDGIDAKYLQGVTYTNSFTVDSSVSSGYWYAICVYDGYGNESEPGMYGNSEIPSDAVTLLTPTNNSTTQWSQQFSWSTIENGTYSLEISSSSDFASTSIVKNSLSTGSTTIDLSGLDELTTYYWRVKSLQPNKLETISSVFSFTTPVKPTAPAVTLIAPKSGIDIEGDVAFSWNKADVDSYILQVSASSSFESLLLNQEVAKSGSAVEGVSISTSQFGKGTFYWRVYSVAAKMKNGESAHETFSITKIATGEYERGYTIKKDPTTYETASDIKCENEWMRSSKPDFSNMTFESDGILNRGMCATSNYVYVAGRTEASQNSTVYLSKYSAQTGEHITDLYLNGASGIYYYPCNDVIKDSKGHIFVTNLTINAANYPLLIHQIDTETGDATLKATCSYTGLTTPRIDHAAIYGDVESGNFYVFAAIAKSNKVVRWTFRNAELSATESCTINSFYPASETTTGIAPIVVPIDENSFFIDGSGTALTRYSFTSGNITDSFAYNSSLSPSSYEANGGCIFSLSDSNYLAYAYGDQTSANGINFMIGATNANSDINGMTKSWILPQTGLGDVYSQTWQSDVDYVATDANSGHLYIYSPGNGLASYKIWDPFATGSANLLTYNSIDIYSNGNEIHFNATVESAEVYSMNGTLIGIYKNVNHITLNLISGAYIVKAHSNAKTSQKVVMIK